MKTQSQKSKKSFRFVKHFEGGPTVLLPGWQIKESRQPHCPVAVVVVPRSCSAKGREKIDLYARMMTQSPRLAEIVRELIAANGMGCHLVAKAQAVLANIDGGGA